MTLQFSLSHEVARLLSCCPANVRERVIHELSQLIGGTLLRWPPPPRNGAEVGVVRLPSGFQVSYRLERSRRRVEVLDLSSGGDLTSASAPH